MRSSFAETPSLLNMAQVLYEALQQDSAAAKSRNLQLKHEFESLVRISHHHRGVLGLHNNKPELSLPNFQSFNNMLREKFGDKSSGTDQSLGVSWNELGNAFLQNKAWKEAKDCFLKSIDALAALDGSTRITISMPLINLAFAYWLEGQLDEAAKTFQDALNNREAEYGVDDKTSFV